MRRGASEFKRSCSLFRGLERASHAVPDGGCLQGQKEQPQGAEAVAEQQGADPQAVQGLWEVDQQEAALPQDGGSPAAQEEPALSPEANNMDDGEEADRQQIPSRGVQRTVR